MRKVLLAVFGVWILWQEVTSTQGNAIGNGPAHWVPIGVLETQEECKQEWRKALRKIQANFICLPAGANPN